MTGVAYIHSLLATSLREPNIEVTEHCDDVACGDGRCHYTLGECNVKIFLRLYHDCPGLMQKQCELRGWFFVYGAI